MKSIQARFVVLMIVIVSTMLGVFGFISYVDSRTQKHQQLNSHLYAIKHRLTQSLPAVIWRYDREQIRQILDAELGSATIVGIAVYDEKERLIYSTPAGASVPVQWETTSLPRPLPSDEFIQTFPLSTHVDGVTELLGNVRIHASSRAIDEALQREAIRLFALILLMNLAIVVALCAVMRMVVMRPLNAVRNGLREIARDGADLSLRLPPSDWREYEDLIDNFNAFVARLESALGASIDEVHNTISRIARGDFSQPVAGADSAPEDTVIARLGLMQNGLIDLTEALRHAKQTADSASQAKTDFLASMSHEIRTPLNAILGMTRLAMRGDVPAAQQVQLQKVMHSANHLLGLINDILDFSKIEAGKLTLESVPFQLADVLDNVVTLVGEKAIDKGLELITDIDPDVPWRLTGDPLRLSQIMVNFATNAVKFTQSGEIVLYIRKEASTPKSVRLRIGVRDTGIGIAADKQSSLFQNFVQADASNSRQYGGTGLGLAITKRLAALMHGQVGMHSIEGVGSNFWCDVELNATAQALGTATVPPPPAPPRRALVIDDHVVARTGLQRLLRDRGVEAQSAEDGPQGLRSLREAQLSGKAFDYVFIDRLMPEMDGLSCAQHIQALQLQPPPHVVLLSATSEDGTPAQRQASGIAAILTKPVHAGALQQFFERQAGLDRDSDTIALPVGTETLRASAGARVLLVEDIEINREVALGLLEDLGIGLIVDFAENGQVALRRMVQQRYDAVFMDMHMPVMDGINATEAIRSHSEWDAIPVIAMTANHMESDIQRCKAAGMCDFVTKPIDPDHLREAIRKWVVSTQVPVAPTVAAPATTAASATSTPSKMRPIVQALQGIVGLDPILGLRHFGDKQATYREMLRQFLQGNRQAEPVLHAALAQQNLSTIEHTAHTLYGTAANVGASLVAEQAQTLRDLARDGAAPADLQAQWQRLQHTLQQLDASVQTGMMRTFKLDHFL